MAFESQSFNQETVKQKIEPSSLSQMSPIQKSMSSELMSLTPVITIFTSDDSSLRKTDIENVDELPVCQETGSVIVEEITEVETAEPEKITISSENQKEITGEVESIVSLTRSTEVYNCGECSYSSHNKHYLKQHVDLVHMSQRPYKCPFCDYAGKRSYSLKEHLIVHSNDWPYQCAHCNATFRKKGHLTNHNKMHTGILLFQCNLCEEQVYTSGGVEDLIQSSASSQEAVTKIEPFRITEKSVCSQNQSGKHLFACTLCDFQTSGVGVLKAHGDSHNAIPVPVRPFSKSGIKNNNDNTNTDTVMIQCTECGFTAKEKYTMTSHMWTHLNKDVIISASLPEQKEKPSEKSEMCLPFSHDKKLLTSSFLSLLTPSSLIYKCTECNFLSKETNILFAHMLQHQKKTLDAVEPNANQSLLDISTAAMVAAATTPPSSTMEESISSLSLSITPETNLGNLVSNSAGKARHLHNDHINKYFQCTICGYTCELQRTIKAHIWKHSGHRDVDYPMFKNGPLSISEDVSNPSGYLLQPFISNLKTKEKLTYQASLTGESPAIVAQVPKLSTSFSPSVCPQHTPAAQIIMDTTMTDIGNLHESPVHSEDSLMAKPSNGEKDKSNISKAGQVYSRHKTEKLVASKNLVLSSCPVKTTPDQLSNNSNLGKVALREEPNLIEFKENTKMIPKRRNCESTENAFHQPLRKKNCIETFSILAKDLQTLEKERSPRENLDNIPVNISRAGDILNIKNQEMTSSAENDNAKNLDFVSPENRFTECKAVKINQPKMDNIVNSKCQKPILDKSTDDQFLSLEIVATNPKNLCVVTPENNQSKQSLENCTLSDQTSENREENNYDSAGKDDDDESAVALLSLLKHLSTFKSGSESSVGALSSNPIDNCNNTTIEPVITAAPNTTTTSGITNVTTTATITASDVKPKMGISSSLLAVIEQLREHSKSESEKCNMSFSDVPNRKHYGNNGSDDKVSLASTKNSETIYVKTTEDMDALKMELNNIEQVQKQGNSGIHFRCKLCHYTNTNHSQLLQHMQFHRVKKPFECSFCKFVAKSSSDLQNHMMQHCKLRTFQCKLCPVTLNFKSQLRAHMRTHYKEEPFICKSCKFETGGLIAYQEHLQQMHAKKAVYFCSKCKEHFLCKQDLQKHQKTTCNSRKNSTSNDDNNYNNKLNIHQSSSVTGMIVCCSKCGQSFSSFVEKEKHATFCKEWLCQKCNFSSNNFATFQNHVQLYCNKSSLECKMCNFTAMCSRSLKSHMKRHVNDQHLIQQLLEQYKCNLCGYVCHHLPSLKSHMWRHASDKNYSYAFTNEVINEAIDYDSHLEHFVDSEDSGSDTADQSFLKPDTPNTSVSHCMVTFRCCQCGFETINKAALNNHMKSHVDVIQQTLNVYRTAAASNKQQPLLVEMNSFLNKCNQDDKTTSLYLITKPVSNSTK